MTGRCSLLLVVAVSSLASVRWAGCRGRTWPEDQPLCPAPGSRRGRMVKGAQE